MNMNMLWPWKDQFPAGHVPSAQRPSRLPISWARSNWSRQSSGRHSWALPHEAIQKRHVAAFELPRKYLATSRQSRSLWSSRTWVDQRPSPKGLTMVPQTRRSVWQSQWQWKLKRRFHPSGHETRKRCAQPCCPRWAAGWPQWIWSGRRRFETSPANDQLRPENWRRLLWCWPPSTAPKMSRTIDWAPDPLWSWVCCPDSLIHSHCDAEMSPCASWGGSKWRRCRERSRNMRKLWIKSGHLLELHLGHCQTSWAIPCWWMRPPVKTFGPTHHQRWTLTSSFWNLRWGWIVPTPRANTNVRIPSNWPSTPPADPRVSTGWPWFAPPICPKRHRSSHQSKETLEVPHTQQPWLVHWPFQWWPESSPNKRSMSSTVEYGPWSPTGPESKEYPKASKSPVCIHWILLPKKSVAFSCLMARTPWWTTAVPCPPWWVDPSPLPLFRASQGAGFSASVPPLLEQLEPILSQNGYPRDHGQWTGSVCERVIKNTVNVFPSTCTRHSTVEEALARELVHSRKDGGWRKQNNTGCSLWISTTRRKNKHKTRCKWVDIEQWSSTITGPSRSAMNFRKFPVEAEGMQSRGTTMLGGTLQMG